MPAQISDHEIRREKYLHIYNRGVDNLSLFSDNEDYQVFLGYLKEYLTKIDDLESRKKSFTVNGKTFMGTPHQPKNYFDKVELLAYILSPNHFHLILRENVDGAAERFIRSLCTRYSIYFNKKNNRHGSLYKGAYKSVTIADTNKILHLICHLHKSHSESNYSSHKDYLDQINTPWINKLKLPPEIKVYENFEENYKYTDAERDLLFKIILEENTPQLAKTPPQILTKNNEPYNPPQKNKVRRAPEYLFLMIAFFVLLNVGAWQIKTKSPALIQAHPVQETTLPKKQETLVLSASSSAIEANDDPDNLIYSLVAVKSGSGEVDVYNEASTDGEVMTRAVEGDTLVATPINTDWYEIRFSDNKNGFILSKYIELKKADN